MTIRRAIVTGAQGFLGAHVVQALRAHGSAVTSITRRATGVDPDVVEMGDAPWSSDLLARVIDAKRPDAFFHLVGGIVDRQDALTEINLGVTRTVMNAIRASDLRPTLICCGSAAEYGNAVQDGIPIHESTPCFPITPYGHIKLIQTNEALDFAAQSAIPVLVARIFNPIGAGMPAYLALGAFSRQLIEMSPQGGILHTGNLDVWRDFLDVGVVAESLVALAADPDARGVINVCSGEATHLRMLVQSLVRASGRDVRITTDASRLRRDEKRVIVGDTGKLRRVIPAPVEFSLIPTIARLWAHTVYRESAGQWS